MLISYFLQFYGGTCLDCVEKNLHSSRTFFGFTEEVTKEWRRQFPIPKNSSIIPKKVRDSSLFLLTFR